jgi:hypothetical protein
MGVRWLASILAALALAAPAQAGAVDEAVRYLEGRQQADGGFAEPGGRSDPGLTAWVALGLAAAGRPPAGVAEYLTAQPSSSATDLELRILALEALGQNTEALTAELEGLTKPSGAIDSTLNSTIWGMIALRAAGREVSEATVRFLLRAQAAGGGSKAIGRALAYLRRLQNRDGGFALSPGRRSDTQSTAWAVQAFVAAGREPGRAAFAYLERMRRRDGSFRYDAGRVSSPVWTTAQVLAALARRPFPLS